MRYGGHGKSNAKIYHIWVNMRQRCSNRSNPAWGRYGGRGIRVCERWESFALFLADMGEPPQGKSLDRIDNDGNYESSNCRWATASEQGNNTRVNHTLTINGETKSVKQWTEIHGIPYKTVMQRIYRGWSLATILGPLKHQGIGRAS